jgi:hypothetical protein
VVLGRWHRVTLILAQQMHVPVGWQVVVSFLYQQETPSLSLDRFRSPVACPLHKLVMSRLNQAPVLVVVEMSQSLGVKI